MSEDRATPTFWLDEDGRHVWWRHHCTHPSVEYPESMLPLYDSGWTLVSADPIHVEPSILCGNPGGCGVHGFIRNGKWEWA